MDRELFCKGYTWGFFSKEGELLTDNAEQSMRRLASNGLDWICITVNGRNNNIIIRYLDLSTIKN